MTQPPRGWSKQDARRLGRRRAPMPGTPQEGCYYCGVLDCDECGDPPHMLDDLRPDPEDQSREE